MRRTFATPKHHTHPSTSGDARSGGGYGKLSGHAPGADDMAAGSYPYRTLTDLETASLSDPDESDIEHSKEVVGRRVRDQAVNDKLQRLNYRSGSFVDGKSRLLAQGIDAHAVLESLIRELVKPRFTIDRRRNREQIPNIGTGATSFSSMSSDMTTRTRSPTGLGSKQGWFSPPPPKDTDPVNDEHACDLQDIAVMPEKRAVNHARREMRRTRSVR